MLYEVITILARNLARDRLPAVQTEREAAAGRVATASAAGSAPGWSMKQTAEHISGTSYNFV